jgi:hypothetical protein
MKKILFNSAMLAAIASLTFTSYVSADHMSPMGEDWVDMPNDYHDLRMEEFEEDGDFVGEAALAATGEMGSLYIEPNVENASNQGDSPLQNTGTAGGFQGATARQTAQGSR